MTYSDPHAALEDWDIATDALANGSTLICCGCVTDPFLWSSVSAWASPASCAFCGLVNSCVPLRELQEAILPVVSDYYVAVGDSGIFHSDGEWSEAPVEAEAVFTDIVYGAVESNVEPALVRYLSQDQGEAAYVEKRDLWGDLNAMDESDWRSFVRDTRQRPERVSVSGASHPAGHIIALTPDMERIFERVCRIAADAGTFGPRNPTLWRCRVGNYGDSFRKAKELGTAPAGKASAGRMNLLGDSVFYGSTTMRGACLEAFYHAAGDASAWVGCFDASREIYTLDVMSLPTPPSVFAPDAALRRGALLFMRHFSEAISQPNDGSSEHYLPTQLFVWFLRNRLPGRQLQAIRYASSLDSASENYVVFVDSSHCSDGPPIDASALNMTLRTGSAVFVPDLRSASALGNHE